MSRPVLCFSVITAAYNAESTLAETIESVIAQSIADWEMLIVDDGSTDRTSAICATYAARDSRIRVVEQANHGCATARNLAVRSTTCPWLCLLDADDMYAPNYLEAQRRFMEQHPGYDIYSCNADGSFPDGHIEPFNRTRRHERISSFALEDLIRDTPINVFSVIRRSCFESVGGFRPGVYVEDYDLWLRALAAGAKHIHNPQTLVTYRVRDDSKSADVSTAVGSAAEVLEDASQLPGVTSGTKRRMLRQALRFRSFDRRRAFEQALSSGVCDSPRRTYFRLHAGYDNKLKYLGGAVLVLLSPHLFATMMGRRQV